MELVQLKSVELCPVLLVVKPYGPIRGDRSRARSAERRGATPFQVEDKLKGAAGKLPGRTTSAKSNFSAG